LFSILVVIFSILILKGIQKSDLLLSTCASLYCSLSKIREDFGELEQQAQVTLPNGNYKTLPQGFPTWGICTPRGTFAYLQGYI